MTVLVVGLSHRTAPVSLLEQVTLTDDGVVKMLHDATRGAHVAEALVVSTCNRLEVYVDAEKFHGGVTDVSELIALHSGVPVDVLTPHLYVHYEDRAVQHLFALVSGLDSMVVGEAQILGQVRAALRVAQTEGTTGRSLNDLVQQALRVGKRAHAETDIDRAAPSLVSAGLDVATEWLGSSLDGRPAVVVGAGAIGGLAGAQLSRSGADLTFVNRTTDRAARLAEDFGGQARAWDELADALDGAEIVVAGTGATGTVLDRDLLEQVRGDATTPLVLLDLALPHDVDPSVTELPGVHLVGLEALAERSRAADPDADRDIRDVRRIVGDEVAAYLSAQRSQRVAPTVVALHNRADQVVDAELERLDARLPGLDPSARDEVAVAMRRAVDKLLHQPTVRMKEFAAESDGVQYAEAVHRLFDLDPQSVEAVTRVDLDGGDDE